MSHKLSSVHSVLVVAFVVVLSVVLSGLTPASVQAAPAAAPALTAITPSSAATRCVRAVGGKTVCAYIGQATSYGHPLLPKGRIVLPAIRAHVAKAQIGVIICRTGVRTRGLCDKILTGGKQMFDITDAYNNTRCTRIIRGGNVFWGSHGCTNGGDNYARIAGWWYITDVALYLNGKYVNSVTTRPYRAVS